MTAKELKKKYLDFFVKRGHKKLPNVSLIPAEVDTSVLFTTAGMHPLVPYLLGESHPLGKRLTSNQRCLRTDDIENVGDGFHHTFFEMLGNWSLDDYWKEETISWSWEFLTKVLGINPKKISVSCFEGDEEAPKDEESANIWRSLGVPKERIYFLDKKENWWGPVGQTGPCGPDTEMFFDTGKPKCSSRCDVSCQCGKYIEIWNDVFMQYNQMPEGECEPLKQKNVDTGMGVERVVAVTNGFNDDNYRTELFIPIIKEIEDISKRKYPGKQSSALNSSYLKDDRPSNKKELWAFRVIADHLRAAVFMIADGVVPSNVEQGYILRRLIRRAIVSGRNLGIRERFALRVANVVVKEYQDEYSHLKESQEIVERELKLEEEKFSKALNKGIGALKKIFGKAIRGVDPENLPKGMVIKDNVIRVSGKEVFRIYETYGLPPELCQEIMTEWGLRFDDQTMEECDEAFKEHQKKSRASLEKKFAGGLVDHSEAVTKLHTATHLLHQALRDVLGDHVHQVGSNITPERLRFDFTHPEKLTETEIKQIEEIVNKQIKADLAVKMEVMGLEEAKKKGALAFFAEKYGSQVKVYSVGAYSCEVCGGPHVSSTGEIGGVKIIKEKPVGAGRRRIYAGLV